MIGSGLLFALACRDQGPRPRVDDEPLCPVGGAPFGEGELLGVDDEVVDAQDWEGDGDVDVFVQREDVVLGVYEQRGDVWSYRSLLEEIPGTTELLLVGLMDVDDDGDLDVLTGERSNRDGPFDNNLQWREHLADGTLDVPRLIDPNTSCAEEYALLDVEGDGDLDVLCWSEFETVLLFENVGDGHFLDDQTLFVVESFHPADLDHDGDLDFLQAPDWLENLGLDDSGIQTARQPEVGSTWHQLPTGSWPHPWNSPPYVYPSTSGDVDGDGDLDIVGVIWDADDGIEPVFYVGWWANVGQGLFAPLRGLAELPADALPVTGYGGIDIVDLDGDGDGDLLYSDVVVRWLAMENIGNAVYVELQSVPNHGIDSRLLAADLDGDGHPELLSDHVHEFGTTTIDSGDDAGDATDAGLFSYENQLPRQPDADADGACDLEDACPGFHDGSDTDEDGIPNGCDTCASPVDTDGDGRADDCDTCPGTPDSADGDLDGVPDVCDRCPTDPVDDTDGDGVCDGVDLCVGFDVAGDLDEDGICTDRDACYGDNATGDSDLDHVCDDEDTCAGFPDIVDLDQNGVPDGCDDIVSSG